MKRAMVAALAGWAIPALGDVIDAGPSGFETRTEQVVSVGPDAAWARFVDEIGAWWNMDHSYGGDGETLTLTAEPGGCLCEGLDAGGVEHLAVVHVRRPVQLSLSGGLGPLQDLGVAGSMRVDFEALEGGESTRVIITYRVGGWRSGGLEGWAVPVSGVIAEQLERYADHVNGAGEVPTGSR